MEIGIIGFGKMGRFLAEQLKGQHKVFASDQTDKSKEAKEIGVSFVDITESASKDIVVLAVPISELENALEEIKDHLKEDSTVLDVCSVKILPSELMEKILPTSVNIIGTHPLFGPQSGKHGIKGLKMVICQLRANNESEAIKKIFNDLGLVIIETTPEEHDKAMAKSHSLMHFIARGMIKFGIENQKIKISALDKAIELMGIFKEDSEQLFRDVQNFNPFAKEIRNRFLKELEKLNNELDK